MANTREYKQSGVLLLLLQFDDVYVHMSCGCYRCDEVLVHMSLQVRNPEMSWHDTRKMLHEDHRWRLTKLLDKTEKLRLFEEHIAALTRRNRELFRRVIDEFINPVQLMTVSWRDARRLIKDDPRFSKFSSSDRVCILSFCLSTCLFIISCAPTTVEM